MDTMNGKILKEGYTFDDVLLIPQASNVLPSEVALHTSLTRSIGLNVPLLSAAMDTVTEVETAIALARQGGIGIIHKNMSISEQAQQVDMVKRSENGMISNPITLTPSATVADADALLQTYRISGIPIIDEQQILVGIVTNRDLKYRTIDKTPLSDIMTHESLITGKVGTTLEEAKSVLLKHRIEKLPIVDDKYQLKGLITIKDIDSVITHPNACKDEQGRLRVGAALGAGGDLLERIAALVAAGVDIVTIDSAHGHHIQIVDTVREMKKLYPHLPIIAGNIVTKEAALDLIAAGADALKVGVGPGSICTTRVVAGVGMPQLSAISDVAQVAKEHGVGVIADGGIKLSGDIVKAIAAGADAVMIGSLFAGTKEAPGEEVILEGRRYKAYVGMGSLSAMARGSKDRYFQTSKEAKKLVPEGIEGRVPYKGELADVVYQLLGGLRSGMGYCGTPTIEDLQQNSKFIRITNAGLIESHPHDIQITKEAPNYQK